MTFYSKFVTVFEQFWQFWNILTILTFLIFYCLQFFIFFLQFWRVPISGFVWASFLHLLRPLKALKLYLKNVKMSAFPQPSRKRLLERAFFIRLIILTVVDIFWQYKHLKGRAVPSISNVVFFEGNPSGIGVGNVHLFFTMQCLNKTMCKRCILAMIFMK